MACNCMACKFGSIKKQDFYSLYSDFSSRKKLRWGLIAQVSDEEGIDQYIHFSPENI